jgi:hypothetical protein
MRQKARWVAIDKKAARILDSICAAENEVDLLMTVLTVCVDRSEVIYITVTNLPSLDGLHH